MTLGLQTPTLRLEPPTAADEEFYVALYTDPEAMRHVVAAQTAEAARRGFQAALRLDAAEPPVRRFWVLRTRADGLGVGLLGLHVDGPGSAEVGAVIVPGWQGRGHATDAIAALADHAFGALGLQRLHTRHNGANGAAGGLMARLGFERTSAAPGAQGWRWELRAERWRDRRDDCSDSGRLDPLG